MIEIRINKEIGEYEAKIIGPFTMRQCICLGIGLPVCYYIFKFLTPILTIDVAGLFCTIPGVIAYAFGWARPYGMKMEEFIHSVFVNRVLAPSIRKYKTENTVSKIISKCAAAQGNENAAEEEEEPEEETGKKKRKHEKKKRYKLSKKAYK